MNNFDVETNKTTFINLLKSITRNGAKTDSLIEKLCNSDFFVAPASTKYHLAVEGGLCEHCLNVYHNLNDIINMKHLEIDNDSIIIVSLLHDLSKMNFYKPDVRNKKVYCESGSKHDEMGRFDWVAEKCYSIRDVDERFLYANHETTAEFMVRCYIPLTVDESIAILHHMGGKSADSAQDEITNIYNRYPLALCLHIADMISTFIDESVN